MLLLHTSDWHLGRMLYGKSLLEDQRYFLEGQLLPTVEQEKPQALLLCGDIYDRPIAPPEAIRLFDKTLSCLLDRGVKVLAISGNHDGADRIALLKGALRQSGVYFATSLEDAFSPVLLEEAGQRVQFFLLPYFDCAQARDFLGDPSLRGEAACMQQLIGRMQALFDPDAAHVLLSHCFCAGSFTSESESGLFVGGSGQVPPALFAPFDYVALGHLHGPQPAGEKARYAGSPLKYSIDEEKQKKGFLLVEQQGHTFIPRHIEAPPLHDVRRVSGLLEDLTAPGADQSGDYVEIHLEDKHPVMMAAEKLRPFYPNLLAVQNRWVLQGAAGRRAEKLQGVDPGAVFGSFLQDVCGIEPEEADQALFREILKEVAP